MPTPYTADKIDHWVSDFILTDALRPFSPATQDAAPALLTAFLSSACTARDREPEDLEESDIRTALMDHIARLNLPSEIHSETPALCAALLASLQAQGRLADGRLLGAFVGALTESYLEQSSGKLKPITRAGSKLGRNDPCPCGSGKKYKKCCLNE